MASRSTRNSGLPGARPPLARMMMLHQKLLARDFPNCRSLAAELGYSSKTIQRDLEFMRGALALPIKYDHARQGYVYTEPVSTFPGMEISSGELVALFVAQKALGQFKGTAYEQRLETAFHQLTEKLDEKITFSWSAVDEGISFHKIGTTEADLRAFEEISRAVLQSLEMAFEYRGLEGEKYVERRVQPYHLGSIENQWYVIGMDLERKQLRTFALSRMRLPKVSETKFQRPDDFSIARHLEKSFGVFAGGAKQHAIRIHFTGAASRLVAERQWHATQRLRELGENKVELTMELCSLREVERWILSWGTRAEVLEPPELIDRLRKSTAAMARLYEG